MPEEASNTTTAAAPESAAATTTTATTDTPPQSFATTTTEVGESFVGRDGSFNWQSGHDYIDADRAKSLQDRGINSVIELDKRYADLEKQFSQREAVPKEATAAAYGFEKPEGMDDSQWEGYSKQLSPYLEKAKELGVTSSQLKALEEINRGQATAQAAEFQKLSSKYHNELISDWGNGFEAKRQTAENFTRQTLANLDIDPSDPAFAQIKDNPVFIRMMHKAAVGRGEDSTEAIPSNGSNMSPLEYARDIQFNESNLKHKGFMEGNAAILNEVSRIKRQYAS